MEQTSLSQRINFLAETLSGSVRAFSKAIEEKPTNTSNYAAGRNKAPADFLEKVLLHFSHINPSWLLTGNVEPFLDSITPTTSANVSTQKNLRSQVITQGKGKATINVGDLEHQLAAANEKIALLTSQLADKERIIAAKDETINLLRASYGRPN